MQEGGRGEGAGMEQHTWGTGEPNNNWKNRKHGKETKPKRNWGIDLELKYFLSFSNSLSYEGRWEVCVCKDRND